MPSPVAHHWRLDPEVTQLNHGSYGGAPVAVLGAQRRVRDEMEADLTRYYMERLTPALHRARAALADFLDADAADLAFVINASLGAATIFANVPLGPGDEVLVSHHEYASCLHQLERDARIRGFRLVHADIPFPLPKDDAEARAAVIDALTDRAGERTRLALVSWITSATAAVFPAEDIARALKARAPECRVVIDAAHAPGQIPVSLRALERAGVDYLTGNLHKWVCAPKGSAFLYVRRDLQPQLRPLIISHGANSPRNDRSRFRLEADWLGTLDPSPWLAVPAALDFVRNIVPGGLHGLREHNRDLVLAGRRLLCEALGVEPPAPESMIGSIASVPLPAFDGSPEPNGCWRDPLHRSLVERNIEVPTMFWPQAPERLLRISAQAFNTLEQYERLAAEVMTLLPSTVTR